MAASPAQRHPVPEPEPVKVLLTGAAGFIGMYTAERLLERGDQVVGADNLNSYYDVGLKQARLARLSPRPGFRFQRLDIAEGDGLLKLFATERFDAVINLAAQAGERSAGGSLRADWRTPPGCSARRHAG